MIEPTIYHYNFLAQKRRKKTVMARIFLAVTAAASLLVPAGAAPALAEMGSGKISEQIHTMFKRFDSNRDGQIDTEEFKDIHMIRFYTADMDNDGQISREELVFVRGMRGVPAERANTAFDRLDTNGNGQLSVKEFDASRASAFASLDLDGDGSISPFEVDQFAVAKGVDDLHESDSNF
jgi:Ca2+-binding EF-hand superfamily protein